MPSRTHSSPSDSSTAVAEFIQTLKEPTKTETNLLMAAILQSADTISEGIKWNAPSYKTTEYFATTNLRTKTGVGLVLHFGAKVRTVAASKDTIDDPKGLLKWVAKDRATIEFKDAKDIEASAPGYRQSCVNGSATFSAWNTECSLTLRSTGPPTAGHLGRATALVHHRPRGQGALPLASG